jgi:hypothetical protein
MFDKEPVLWDLGAAVLEPLPADLGRSRNAELPQAGRGITGIPDFESLTFVELDNEPFGIPVAFGIPTWLNFTSPPLIA